MLKGIMSRSLFTAMGLYQDVFKSAMLTLGCQEVAGFIQEQIEPWTVFQAVPTSSDIAVDFKGCQ